MSWIVALKDDLYLSTEHYLGPHIWNEPGAECWSYSADGGHVVVPPGCYHATLTREDAAQWVSFEEADRIARAATDADRDGDRWLPVQI